MKYFVCSFPFKVSKETKFLQKLEQTFVLNLKLGVSGSQ